ncbi:hypothetical protein AVEN_225064-1 [Araneus ventricosus]|uniref:Uncharacterized protein n=1 Tax=Araneus ventricosus TaxID=182803 RepID=A0A4Y2J984_ARAVE|nr:hypothetical protein AVEN_225064-1 [Araneus ventricosus]
MYLSLLASHFDCQLLDCMCAHLQLSYAAVLEEWQSSWKNGNTGRRINNIMASVSPRPTNWIGEDVIFFSQHGPFPAYLKRFHLSDSDYCSCGRIGMKLHYATECIYTVSWHMRKPAPNFEQE